MHSSCTQQILTAVLPGDKALLSFRMGLSTIEPARHAQPLTLMDSRIDALFLMALQIPPGTERDAFLEEACKDDTEVRRRLKEMLADDDAADAFFDRPDTVDRSFFASAIPGEKPGDMIGRYKLLENIGEGGFGTVWRAEQSEPVQRRVALKIIRIGMDTREFVARFEQERQALAMMDHPHIARVLDGGATPNGRPYFVMELVTGVPVTRFCDEQKLSLAARLELFIEICRAIQHAHQKGIIHRDIKPSNIMVTLDGDKPVPKVIDFGIAKAMQGKLTDKTVLTRLERFIGTPAYMSPEQAGMLADIDTRSDIYALGVLLYELQTGKPPFDTKSLISAGYEEMRRIIREVEPSKPSSRLSNIEVKERTTLAEARRIEPGKLSRMVEPDLDWIVMKAIEKDRWRRYGTVNGLALDIQRFLSDEAVSATPPSAGYRFRNYIRRNKKALWVAAVITAVLVVANLFSAWQVEAILRDVLGPQHPDTRKATYRLAGVYADAARPTDAFIFGGATKTSRNVSFPAVHATIVAPNSVWKWLHPVNGQDPEESMPGFHQAFSRPTFKDTHWKTGRDSAQPMGGFGYGSNFAGVDIGRPPIPAHRHTAYLRHAFTTDKEFSQLELRCERDDGIIAYLDGKEVGRNNMQTGDDAYLLSAAEPMWPESDGNAVRLPISGILSPGAHVLAVSVHNSPKPGSTDLRLARVRQSDALSMLGKAPTL